MPRGRLVSRLGHRAGGGASRRVPGGRGFGAEGSWARSAVQGQGGRCRGLALLGMAGASGGRVPGREMRGERERESRGRRLGRGGKRLAASGIHFLSAVNGRESTWWRGKAKALDGTHLSLK
jgi:hypothetical protein